MIDFTSRFKILDPNFDETILENLLDDEVKDISQELYEMIKMVKRHSVLLTKKTPLEIYYAITQHADPRIGLILAAGRDKSGEQLFPTIAMVLHSMFATDLPGAPAYPYVQRLIFITGITRVSAQFAAALLIGQLAQIPEQAAHAQLLEKSAIEDLDRILNVPNIIENSYITNDNEVGKTDFYFIS